MRTDAQRIAIRTRYLWSDSRDGHPGPVLSMKFIIGYRVAFSHGSLGSGARNFRHAWSMWEWGMGGEAPGKLGEGVMRTPPHPTPRPCLHSKGIRGGPGAP